MRAPLTVYVQLTKTCDVDCCHCLVEKESIDMPLQRAKALVDELIQEKVFKVYFTGGEPLLYPHLFELLEHIKEHSLWSLVQTNGLHITDTAAELLYESGVGACDISLYGITPETHDAITGVPGSFETLLSGFEKLNHYEVRAFVSLVILSSNLKEVPHFFEWALEKGISLAHIRRYIPWKVEDQLTPDPEKMWPLIIEYSQRRDEYDEKGLHYEIEEAFHVSELLSSRCPAGIQLCQVTAEGTITPCPYMKVQGESVFEKGFKKVWETSSLLEKIRQAAVTEGKCRICTLSGCSGGCIAAGFNTTGILKAPDPFCLVHPDSL